MNSIESGSVSASMPNAEHEKFSQELYSLREPLLKLALGFANGRQHDAEDLVQETFFRALRSEKSYVDTSMLAWTSTILRNLAVNKAHKDKSMLTETDTDSNFSEMIKSSVADDRSPLINLELLDDRIKRAIEALFPAYREALLLKFGGKSDEEIAKIQGVPENTVSTRIHRAIERIRDSLRVANELPKLSDIL